MKNIKCLLSHKFMHYSDVVKSVYDSKEDNITLYRCKHCDKVVKEHVNYVNAEFVDKDKETTKPDIDIKIREHQGWSITNTKNSIYLSGSASEGTIHLVSKDEINKVEQMGLLELIEQSFNFYEGLDIKSYVYESEYKKSNDNIIRKYYDNDIPFINTNNCSDKFSKSCDFTLDEAKTIITIQ